MNINAVIISDVYFLSFFKKSYVRILIENHLACLAEQMLRMYSDEA